MNYLTVFGFYQNEQLSSPRFSPNQTFVVDIYKLTNARVIQVQHLQETVMKNLSWKTYIVNLGDVIVGADIEDKSDNREVPYLGQMVSYKCIDKRINAMNDCPIPKDNSD